MTHEAEQKNERTLAHEPFICNATSRLAVLAVVLVMFLPCSDFIEVGYLGQTVSGRAWLTGRTISKDVELTYKKIKSNNLLGTVLLIWPEQLKPRPPPFVGQR